MRGPLAPKRDSGPEAQYYGALPPHAVHAPKVAKHLQRKFINLAPGDRVCLLKGQNKGKILEVMRVDPETDTVTVKNAMQVIILTFSPGQNRLADMGTFVPRTGRRSHPGMA
jgi:large subunit ribosomal protein L24